ncbi:MAG: hypothetical protein KF781_11385, partial [Chitinophagaceae bacterium]|nr:hypothetical protein [Chitinophagaceae bacterium]
AIHCWQLLLMFIRIAYGNCIALKIEKRLFEGRLIIIVGFCGLAKGRCVIKNTAMFLSLAQGFGQKKIMLSV